MSDSGGPRSEERRDNGLHAGAYAVVGDVDSARGQQVLDFLRGAGIAAYLTPPATQESLVDAALLPHRLLERLWVDAGHRDRLTGAIDGVPIVGMPPAPVGPPGEAPPVESSPVPASLRTAGAGAAGDLDDAFADIVRRWHDPGGPPSWPESESLTPSPERPRADPSPARAAGQDPPDSEDHYVPPEPEPLPAIATSTRWCLLSMAVGVLLLVAPTLIGLEHTMLVAACGVGAILGAAGVLIARMREGPPGDGWDDGAVV